MDTEYHTLCEIRALGRLSPRDLSKRRKELLTNDLATLRSYMVALGYPGPILCYASALRTVIQSAARFAENCTSDLS